MDLLATTSSIMYVSLCAVVTIWGILALSFKWTQVNNKLLLIYALLGATGTVLNTSITKLVQMDLNLIARACFVLVYVLLSCLCLGVQAVANSSLVDPSAFVPISA